MPSGGKEGSFGLEAEPWLVLAKAGEALEPVGVMVAETEERCGIALCLLKIRDVTVAALGPRLQRA